MAKMQTFPDDAVVKSTQISREQILEFAVGGLFQGLEEIVGSVEANGYFTLVGKSIGDKLYNIYLDSLGVEVLSKKQLFSVLHLLSSRMENELAVAKDGSFFEFSRTFKPIGGVQIDNRYLGMVACGLVGHMTAQSVGQARVLLCTADNEGTGKVRMQVYLDDLEGEGQIFYRDDPDG